MNLLGNGLSAAIHHEDACSVKEADLAIRRRLGAPELNLLVVQSNLALTYQALKRREKALQMRRDVYSGYLRCAGEENPQALEAANNYADSLGALQVLSDNPHAIEQKTQKETITHQPEPGPGAGSTRSPPR